MVAEHVSVGERAPHQRGALGGVEPDDEKGRRGVRRRQGVENRRRKARVGAVVERERHLAGHDAGAAHEVGRGQRRPALFDAALGLADRPPPVVLAFGERQERSVALIDDPLVGGDVAPAARRLPRQHRPDPRIFAAESPQRHPRDADVVDQTKLGGQRRGVGEPHFVQAVLIGVTPGIRVAGCCIPLGPGAGVGGRGQRVDEIDGIAGRRSRDPIVSVHAETAGQLAARGRGRAVENFLHPGDRGDGTGDVFAVVLVVGHDHEVVDERSELRQVRGLGAGGHIDGDLASVAVQRARQIGDERQHDGPRTSSISSKSRCTPSTAWLAATCRSAAARRARCCGWRASATSCAPAQSPLSSRFCTSGHTGTPCARSQRDGGSSQRVEDFAAVADTQPRGRDFIDRRDVRGQRFQGTARRRIDERRDEEFSGGRRRGVGA